MLAAHARQAQQAGRVRLFFALWPDEVVARRLHDIAGRLAVSLGGRVMKKDTLHLTLAFVGDVAEEALPDLLAIGAEVAAGDAPPGDMAASEVATGLAASIPAGIPASIPAAKPASLRLDRLGYWPHNRILWAGCERRPAAADFLAARLTGALQGRGYCLQSLAFVPHLTLLRQVRVAPAVDSQDELHDSPLLWSWQRFVLVRSRHSQTGAAYETIAAWPLRSGDA